MYLFPSQIPALGPAGGDFLSRLLVYIPENRLSAEQALLHPFLSRVMFSVEQQMDLLRVQTAGNVGVLLLTGTSLLPP